MFSIIKRVAQAPDKWHARMGYVLGSALGTYIGIVVSKAVTGK